MRFFHLLLLVAVVVGGVSCKNSSSVKDDLMPEARGEDDEIILVIDSTQWEGPVGAYLTDMYREFLRGMPQDEPKFSLNKVNPLKFNNVLRNAKNLILVMTLDSRTAQSRAIREFFTDNSLKMIQRDSSLYYTVHKDEFAKGQIVLYLFAQDEAQLLEHLKDNRYALVEIFESAVRERTRSKVLKKTEKEAMAAIGDKHEYSLQVPFGYDVARNEEDFVWLRKLNAQSEWNVFVYEGQYRDQNVFNNVDVLRDDITSNYLRDSEKQELFITRQEIVPVFTERVTFDGRFAVEARGLWKVSDGSAGGPFVSYTLVDEATQKLYYVEGYVYSPGTTKKELIREVEAILSTFKLEKKEAS